MVLLKGSRYFPPRWRFVVKYTHFILETEKKVLPRLNLHKIRGIIGDTIRMICWNDYLISLLHRRVMNNPDRRLSLG